MGQNNDQRGEVVQPLSEAATAWGKALMSTHRASRETGSGVLGYGRNAASSD